jgi:hypothetical protein
MAKQGWKRCHSCYRIFWIVIKCTNTRLNLTCTIIPVSVIGFVNIRTYKRCMGFEILIEVVMMSSVFGDMTRLAWWKSNEVSDEYVASIFRVADPEDMFLRNVGWLPLNYTAIPEDTALHAKFTLNSNILSPLYVLAVVFLTPLKLKCTEAHVRV